MALSETELGKEAESLILHALETGIPEPVKEPVYANDVLADFH